jgi:hypothetical protein
VLMRAYGATDAHKNQIGYGYMFHSHGGSRRFESCCAHHRINNLVDAAIETWCHLVPFNEIGTKIPTRYCTT